MRTLRHPEFLAGRTDTAFFDRVGLDALAAPLAGPARSSSPRWPRRWRARPPGGGPPGVLAELPGGWRNVPSQFARAAFEVAGETVEVGYRHTRDGLLVEGRDDVVLVSATPDEVVLEVAGVGAACGLSVPKSRRATWRRDGWAVALRALPRFPDAVAPVAEGSLVAPMPGTVTAVHVAVGDRRRGGPAAAGAGGDEDAAPRCGARTRASSVRS